MATSGGGTGFSVANPGNMRIEDGATNGLASVSQGAFADGATFTGALQTVAELVYFNESTFDRVRGNIQGTLLASAARTATTGTPSQINYNGRGVFVTLNVTVASGTGGLKVHIRGSDPVSGTLTIGLLADAAFITAIGLYGFLLYPGPVATVAQNTVDAPTRVAVGNALPRVWQAAVEHGDATSYTYSLGFQLIV